VLVRSRKAKELMLQEPSISAALANAEKVDLALVGIGEVARDSNLVRSGYLTAEHLAEIRSRGAVGEVLMSCYDARGRPVRMSFQDRVTALDLAQVARIPCVVAVAFGPRKLAALRGALAGDFLHGLVTDRTTAEALLA
jgi:DNA-binding transcriptional regulator LsrR (DeoR family)